MAYERQTFVNNETVLKAEHLTHIEDGVVANEEAISSVGTTASNAITIASNSLTTAEAANTNATTANTTASEAYAIAEEANQTAQGKQTALESGVNIKTINGESILGEGNITIEADVDLDSKQDKLVSGTNIKTINGESILGSGNITIKSNSVDFSNVIPKPLSEDYYSGKTVACVGDSITAGVGGSPGYVVTLGELLGATMNNLGASGTVLCTGGHRTCNISKLTESNLTGASAVTILMGINDWDQAKEGYYELGEYGSTDTTTIYGAVDMWCKRVDELRALDSLKDTKFFFCTPIITSWNNSVGSSSWDQNKTNIHGYTLRELCYAIINVCADYKIPVLDLNLYSGIYYNSEEDNTTSIYFGDGIHPNTAGHTQIANIMKEYLIENPTYSSLKEVSDYILETSFGELNKLTYPNFSNVTTKVIALESITLSATSVSMTAGDTHTVTATLTPTDTTQTSLKWTSDNSSIASVTDGIITAIAEGTTTITCTSTENTNISASVSVSVAEASSTDLTSLQMSESTTTVNAGETKILSVTYVPANTTQTGVTWTSSDENVATVVDNGDSTATVTAVNEGQCYITATSSVNNNISAQCFFTTSAGGSDSSDLWALDSKVIYDSTNDCVTSTETLNATIANSVAIYKLPLKQNMEMEVAYTWLTGSPFAVIGLDTTTTSSDLLSVSNMKNIKTGLVNLYYDNPNNYKNVQYILPNTTITKKTLISTGGRDTVTTIIFKRDANGVLTATSNGLTATFPDGEYTTQANESENLYVFICGASVENTFKVNYLGEIRD